MSTEVLVDPIDRAMLVFIALVFIVSFVGAVYSFLQQ